jgi:hypothetical protein
MQYKSLVGLQACLMSPAGVRSNRRTIRLHSRPKINENPNFVKQTKKGREHLHSANIFFVY